MEKVKCHNCSVELKEDMELQYSDENCEFFCSRKCAIEFYIKEMGIHKVDVKKIRDCDEFTYLADGYLYYSDIEDNACANCKDGLYKFHKFENIKDNRYEIYRCSDCGKEVRIRCK